MKFEVTQPKELRPEAKGNLDMAKVLLRRRPSSVHRSTPNKPLLAEPSLLPDTAYIP